MYKDISLLRKQQVLLLKKKCSGNHTRIISQSAGQASKSRILVNFYFPFLYHDKVS